MMRMWAATWRAARQRSFLLFALFFAAAFACQSFLHAFLFAWLQVKGVAFHFLDNVLLLNLPLKAPQSIFERLAFLRSNFCQRVLHPQTGPG